MTTEIAALRAKLTTLRGQATSIAAQSAVDNAASALQDFEQMDRRARDYVHGGQKLLASDVIYAESLQITGAMAGSLAAARSAELQAGEVSIANSRRSQILGCGAAAVVALLVIVLLVPHHDAPAIPAATATQSSPWAGFSRAR